MNKSFKMYGGKVVRPRKTQNKSKVIKKLQELPLISASNKSKKPVQRKKWNKKNMPKLNKLSIKKQRKQWNKQTKPNLSALKLIKSNKLNPHKKKIDNTHSKCYTKFLACIKEKPKAVNKQKKKPRLQEVWL